MPSSPLLIKEIPRSPGISFLQAVGSEQPAQPRPFGMAFFGCFCVGFLFVWFFFSGFTLKIYCVWSRAGDGVCSQAPGEADSLERVRNGDVPMAPPQRFCRSIMGFSH